MGIFDSLRRQDVNITVQYINNVIETINGMSGADLYETQDALHAVVDFKASSIAALPLKVYVRGENGDRRRDTTSEAALLLKYPNDRMTTFDLISSLGHEVFINGWALWLRLRDKKSPSGWSIEPIPTSWVLNTKTDGFKILEYQIGNPAVGLAPQWFSADQFIRFAYYNPASPTKALSPIKPLKNILNEQINAYAFRNQLWQGQGRFNAYLSRSADAPEWTQEQRDRFLKAWKESRTGNGKLSGQIPVLEDGMELKITQFNAKEAEWAEATQLSREAVAAVYHITPEMVWSAKGLTYASVKENARSLYVDSLGPDLRMMTDVINTFLLPSIGADPKTYAEFDLQGKLAGSFEEQAGILSTAVGAPWLTRAEARERMNLPRIEGTDDLIIPLNVIEGGQPSPHTPLGDGAEPKAQVPAEKSPETPLGSDLPGGLSNKGTETPEKDVEAPEGPRTVKIKGAPRIDDVQDLSALFRTFVKRQRKSVLPQIDRARDKGKLCDVKASAVETITDEELEAMVSEWFDFERWDEELTQDLRNKLTKISVANIKEILDEIYEAPGEYDEEYAMEYIERLAQDLAHDWNRKTAEELIRAIDDAESFDSSDALKSTPQGVFDFAEETRSDNQGRSLATQIRGWSSVAAVHMSGKGKTTTKTWRVTSGNPRPSHAKLNGETIPYENPLYGEPYTNRDGSESKRKHGEHNRFSNGCRWPGDYNSNVREVAGCRCELEIEVSF